MQTCWGFQVKHQQQLYFHAQWHQKAEGEMSGYGHRILNFKGSLQLSHFFILAYILSQDPLPQATHRDSEKMETLFKATHTSRNCWRICYVSPHFRAEYNHWAMSPLHFHFHMYTLREQAGKEKGRRTQACPELPPCFGFRSY